MKNFGALYIFQILKVLLIIKEYKIQLVYQFLYFLLIYIASEFTLADIIFTTFWNLIQHLLKKDFRHQFSFFNGFPQTPHRLNDSNSLSVTKVFCWCSLNSENFWFYIWVAIVFTTQMNLCHLLPMPINNILECKDKYILKCWERSAKRKSNIIFRVIKNLSFDQRFLIWIKPF